MELGRFRYYPNENIYIFLIQFINYSISIEYILFICAPIISTEKINKFLNNSFKRDSLLKYFIFNSIYDNRNIFIEMTVTGKSAA